MVKTKSNEFSVVPRKQKKKNKEEDGFKWTALFEEWNINLTIQFLRTSNLVIDTQSFLFLSIWSKCWHILLENSYHVTTFSSRFSQN